MTDAVQLVENVELVEHVRRVVDQMPEPRRSVFILSRVDRLTYQEIAASYGLSCTSVKRMILRSMCEAMREMNLAKTSLHLNASGRTISPGRK